MNAEVRALADTLDSLRDRLMATPNTTAGFREMRQLHRHLTDVLIDAGERADRDIAQRIAATAQDVVQEWQSNREKLTPWFDILGRVVAAVDGVVGLAGLTNPLKFLLG